MLAAPLHRPIAVAVLGLLALAPASAAAQPLAGAARSAKHPFFAALTAGPTLALSEGATSQLKLEQHVARRLGGALGPQLGAVAQEAFGNGAATIQLGLRFGWALRPLAGLRLQLVPSLQLGYAAVHFSGPFGLGGWAHRFEVQLGAELRLPVGQRWYALLRPVTFEIQADDDGATGRYDVLGGVGRSL